MQTVRRLYVYLLSGVSLGFLLYGLVTLLEVVFWQVGIGLGPVIGAPGGQLRDPLGARQQLSLAAALIGVGLPVWGIHWWFAERGLRPGRPHAEDERGSTVRALYLTLVLVALLGVGASAGRDLLRESVLRLLPQPFQDGYFPTTDQARSSAVLLVAAVAWAYHVTVRRRDMAHGPLRGAAAWLPRVYVYGTTFVAMILALQSFGDLARYAGEAIWPPSPVPDQNSFATYGFADSVSSFAVWVIGWLGHWWYAGRLVGASGWRAVSERGARLRLAFFVAVIMAGAFSVIRLAAEALRSLLVPAFGANQAFGLDLVGADLLRALAVALVGAVPWALAWWLHQRRMHEEALEAGDPARDALARRLDLHAVALVGLAFGAVGSGWLIGLLIDVLLGGSRTVSGDGYWRVELATYIPFVVLGLLVWLWRWWPIQARNAADPSGDAASTVRRSFLLIILAGSVIGALGSLALILYRLFGSLLGANLGGDAVTELSTPIGALLVAGAVALYHGLVLRRDLDLRAVAPPPIAEPAAAAAPTGLRAVVVHGPADGDLDAAIGAMRDALPPGFTLEER